jgi:hypothetical protein
MKVKFVQSGGYAGLRMGCDLDTDSLPAEEAAMLQSLVEQSGFFQAESGSTPTARDLLNYSIAVETNEGDRQISFDDLSMPDGVAPLVKYLQSRAKPVR